MKSGQEKIHVDTTPVKIYQRKGASRLVAILELMGELIFLCVFVVEVYLRVVDDNSSGLPEPLIFSWEELAVAPFYLVVSMSATYLLLEATNTEVNAKIALKKTKIWMGASIVIFVVVLIRKFLRGDIIAFLVSYIVRGAFMIIVGKFIFELNEVLVVDEMRSNANLV